MKRIITDAPCVHTDRIKKFEEKIREAADAKARAQKPMKKPLMLEPSTDTEAAEKINEYFRVREDPVRVSNLGVRASAFGDGPSDVVVQPTKEPGIARHVHEALEELRCSFTRVEFLHRNKSVTDGYVHMPVARDEVYYDPETGESEGSEGVVGDDSGRGSDAEGKASEGSHSGSSADQRDWWGFARQVKPPDFKPDRPDPILVYHGISDPRSNPAHHAGAPRSVPAPRVRDRPINFMITFRELRLENTPAFEPLECELFVADIIKKRRVSEVFRFRLDPGKDGKLQYQSQVKSAIFSVPKKSGEFFLFLQVKKHLTGEPSSFESIYTRGGNERKLRDATELVRRSEIDAPKFRQVFAFGFSPLFLLRKDNVSAIYYFWKIIFSGKRG